MTKPEWRKVQEARAVAIIRDSRTLEEAAERMGLSLSHVGKIAARNPSSLLKVCAWCDPKRLIRADGTSGEVYIARAEHKVSHGICLDCECKVLSTTFQG